MQKVITISRKALLEQEYWSIQIGKSGDKLRIYIPKELQEKAHLKVGQVLAAVIAQEDGEDVIKMKVVKNPFRRSANR